MRLLQAALLAWLVAGCADRPEPAAVGTRLPAFQLRSLEGTQVDAGRFAGRPLLINVWATWCEPCRREMAGLQALADRYAPTRLQVLGITVDDDVNLAREFLRREEVRFMNLSDPARAYVRGALGVEFLPHTLLVARDGTVVERVAGARDWADPAAQAEVARRLGLQ